MEPLSEEIGPVNKPAAADLQTRLVRILSPETNGHDFRTRENTRAEGRGCLPLQGVRAAVRPVVSPEDKGFRGAAAQRIALTPRRAAPDTPTADYLSVARLIRRAIKCQTPFKKWTDRLT